MGRQRQRQRQRERQKLRQREQTAAAPPSAQPPRAGSRRPAAGGGFGKAPLLAGVVILLAAIGFFGYQIFHGGSSNVTTPNRQGTAVAAGHGTPTPLPTAPASVRGAATVDGVACAPMEQLAYHIHQHITLYENGKPVLLPALVGIPTYTKNGSLYARCYYWIHVHDQTGIIHVESPTQKIYPLGVVFDIWKATENTTYPPEQSFINRLEKAKPSQVTAYLNGKPWRRSYRWIPLTVHAVITIELGKPIVPPKPFTNWQGQ